MNDDLISRSALLEKAIEEKRFVFRVEDLLREEVIFQTVYKDLASFILSAPAVDAGPKWISVKDRLPEDLPENKGRKVIPCLVSLESVYPNGKPTIQKRQRQVQYYGSAGWVWEWSRIGASRVTHWMPLPEPPKED